MKNPDEFLAIGEYITPPPETDDEILIAALSDPDCPPLTERQLMGSFRICDVPGETHRERLRNATWLAKEKGRILRRMEEVGMPVAMLLHARHLGHALAFVRGVLFPDAPKPPFRLEDVGREGFLDTFACATDDEERAHRIAESEEFYRFLWDNLVGFRKRFIR